MNAIPGKYAVVRILGKQYRVSEGDEILVDGFESDDLKVETLLLVDKDKTKIGKPTLEKVSIKYEVLGKEKGEKIDVIKYKSKSRYRRHLGFRPQFTRLKILKIS